jgi:hypothetical protein
MRTVEINKKKVRLYDSIDEMPIVNFQKYNKYLLIDSGIGSSVDDVDSHIIKIAKYIKSNDSKNALVELQNMRNNLHMINSELSPKHLAFSALIHSIDGDVLTDMSDENLKSVLSDLNEAKHSFIVETIMSIKKKFRMS